MRLNQRSKDGEGILRVEGGDGGMDKTNGEIGTSYLQYNTVLDGYGGKRKLRMAGVGPGQSPG